MHRRFRNRQLGTVTITTDLHFVYSGLREVQPVSHCIAFQHPICCLPFHILRQHCE